MYSTCKASVRNGNTYQKNTLNIQIRSSLSWPYLCCNVSPM